MRKAMHRLGLLVSVPALFLVLAGTVQAQHDADHKAVKAAVLDYVDGIYLVQPERIERSVAKDLRKIGYWRGDGSEEYRELPMSYEELYQLAATWNSEGRVDAATAPKEIVVYDVLDKTATVKLTAAWGVDYMQLAKRDGKWMIVNVIWQSTET